jgi:hypothetical protein
VQVRYPALEHGTTRAGRWLRARRLRIALWVAVVEGVLVLFDAIPAWVALLAGAAVVAFYVFVGRELTSDTGRQLSWIAALAQVFVAFVPVLVFFVGVLAVIALAILAVVALLALFADRR